jgi:predicted nuclease of predicted toxin-antitoxin system
VRFLADESCDFAIVRALRAAGHDVLAVAELSPRSDDSHVMDLALREKRILLTEDKDFGQLVYASAQPSGGVILIRYPANARKSLPKAVADLIRETGGQLIGSLAVFGSVGLRARAADSMSSSAPSHAAFLT